MFKEGDKLKLSPRGITNYSKLISVEKINFYKQRIYLVFKIEKFKEGSVKWQMGIKYRFHRKIIKHAPGDILMSVTCFSNSEEEENFQLVSEKSHNHPLTAIFK